MLFRDVDLNDIHLFTKVASLGSFTKAAAFFGLPTSSVSRKVSRLEDHLGVRLLERSTRSLRLTPVGALFFQYASQGLEEIQHGTRALSEVSDQPRGRLRISAPILLGQALLGGLIREFMQRYSAVRCVLELNNRQVDLVHEDFDLAIRVGPLEESKMIARKIGHIPMGLFASQAYLDSRGMPHSPTELSDHDLLDLGPGKDQLLWPMTRGDARVKLETRPKLATADLQMVVGATRDGLGIGKFPQHVGEEAVTAGDLVAVLEDWHLPAPEVHAVYPHYRSATPALRAFLEALTSYVKDTQTLLQP